MRHMLNIRVQSSVRIRDLNSAQTPGWTALEESTRLLTKLLLTATAVQVNPEFAANVVLHTGVFLIVKSIQSPADNRVHLKWQRNQLKRQRLPLENSLYTGQHEIH